MGATRLEKEATSSLNRRMRPHANAIYASLFPDCDIKQGNESEDREHAIDYKLTYGSQLITVQEKFRHPGWYYNRNDRVCRACPDFTQEYMNAAGTPWESPGEWFHLDAQRYFYGWAERGLKSFVAWVLLDVRLYQAVVNREGGLGKIGVLKKNGAHGRTNFYAIPIDRLADAIIADNGRPWQR